MTANPMPGIDVGRVQRYCEQRVPDHALHQVRVECQVEARALTIVERRAPWHPNAGPEWTSFPVARLRWTATTRTWQLYWRDRNLKFHHYDRVPASSNVSDLLAEIDRDPTGTFWG